VEDSTNGLRYRSYGRTFQSVKDTTNQNADRGDSKLGPYSSPRFFKKNGDCVRLCILKHYVFYDTDYSVSFLNIVNSCTLCFRAVSACYAQTEETRAE
jgi:hypothetical protein